MNWIIIVCLLSSWIVYTGCQEGNATLTTLSLQPCSQTRFERVSLYKSDIYTVMNNVSLCARYWNPNKTNAFRVYTYAEGIGVNLSHTPIVFVIRQQEDGIISWTIPLCPLGFSTLFYQVDRTVCPISLQQRPDNLPLLYVDVFTSSPIPVDYEITIEAEEDFEIKVASEEVKGEKLFLITGASTPQIRYVKFPENTDVLTIQIDTENFKCAFVSIQNNSCPVNDLLNTARSRGIFQTMSTSAFLTVRADDINDREFLIIIITTNYSVCHGTGYIQPPFNTTDPFEQEFSLFVKQLPPISAFGLAIALPVIVYTLVWIIGLLVPFFCCPQVGWTLCCNCMIVRKDQPDQLLSDSPKPDYSSAGSTPLETMQHDVLDETESSDEDTNAVDKVSRKSKLYDESLEMSARFEKDEGKLKLNRLSKKRYKQMNKVYSVYSWNTITVGIFYALPAFQLVLSEQRILNTSGNQDQCYYNFKCTYPVGVFSAFNTIWSNIGYVMLGALFLVIVAIRQCLYIRRRTEDRIYVDTHGVPQYFGIFYAMGIALIIEGFMSAFYHICPTNANFQFDTAFMFIIGGLFLVKVFQNRHPDIHGNAFLAFFAFAVLLIFALFGLYYDRENPVVTRVIVFLLLLGLVLIFFVSIYHFNKFSLRKKALTAFFTNFKSYFTTWPRHKGRFVKFLIAFILNVILVILVIVLHSKLDIASSIVVFFLMNLTYFIAYYTFQKVWYREPLTILALILPLLIFVFWGSAFWFFFNHVSNWAVTPAESRELNQKCIILGFYDNHDVWHFLSATAMFFSFLYMLVVDDGVMNVKREDLHIF